MKHVFATIEQALKQLRSGKMIILIDGEDRKHTGNLVIAAEYITPEKISFMSRYGGGIICLAMADKLIDKLQLPMMTENNKSTYSSPFTISIEAAKNVSSGISAKDRAQTIKVAISPKSGPNDIVSPGHIFPLRAKTNGVLERAGHTEASVDLARLAGLIPAAVICDIIKEDSTLIHHDELIIFAKKYKIPLIAVKDLIEYRLRHELLIHAEASARIPLIGKGDFNMTLFKYKFDNAEHLALENLSLSGNQVPLVRIHSECLTGDVFGSVKCDCGHQLDESLSLIAAQGGILIYLRQEGRGIGLANKLKAYALQEQGFDTIEANHRLGLPIDDRNYVVAYQILKYFGIESIRLLTNNPIKIKAMESFGIKVEKRLALEIEPNKESQRYLKTKKEKMGHLLTNPLLTDENETKD